MFSHINYNINNNYNNNNNILFIFYRINLLNANKVNTTQFVGSFDDILGISILPKNTLTETLSISTLNESLTTNLQYTSLPLIDDMRIAIVSNSPVVHVLNNNSSSLPLVGHTDIVLTVQCSIDGYSLIYLFHFFIIIIIF